MTSPTSAATSPLRLAARRGRRGFTLIELLVVIGILTLLAAILLPMVMKAFGKASAVRMSADLAAIGTALEAYRQDHGAYPLVREQAGINDAVDRPNPPTGAQILCQALIGPAPAVENSPPANERAKHDGADGPGFRTRPQGRVFGPYLNPEQFRIGVPFTEPLDQSADNVLLFCILDRNDYPILYFPASPAKPNVREPAAGSNPQPYIDVKATPVDAEMSRFDARDNLVYLEHDGTTAAVALQRMRLLFGDRDADGVIGPGDEPVDLPFALWSAGSDDVFGPRAEDAHDRNVLDWNDVAKCDDITNFR